MKSERKLNLAGKSSRGGKKALKRKESDSGKLIEISTDSDPDDFTRQRKAMLEEAARIKAE